jgi:predicted kinase
MKMPLDVVFYKGLPGSGKSTEALEFCKRNPNWIRVCRDSVRENRGKYWLPEQEDYITAVEKFMVKEALLKGHNVIVDAMNFNIKGALEWTKFLDEIRREYNLDIKVCEHLFNTPVEVCIERDAMRPKERRVGAKLIKEFYYKYVAKVNHYKPIDSFPHAIICDLDGTIALNENRQKSYDYSTVIQDKPNSNIIKIIEWYLQHDTVSVLFVSGREDICEQDTRLWLKTNIQMKYDEYMLFMRKTGDSRDDRIVKREIFDAYIRNNFYIDFVLDDRNKVVEMWRRELGLQCLQVADGDF